MVWNVVLVLASALACFFGVREGLRRTLIAGRFDRVYDLQNDSSSNLIFQALRPLPPEWSGTALGCAG